jgi:ribonucleoside-triphosphate reductase
MLVIKKDGRREAFDQEKIRAAISKSAERVMIPIADDDLAFVVEHVKRTLGDVESVTVNQMHSSVEMALDDLNPSVAKSYRDYRNYKQEFWPIMDKVYKESQSIRYIGDRSNANTDSALVSTQRSLIYQVLNGELYKKFFLNAEELEAMQDGYIYIHDRSSRLDCPNCSLCDMTAVLTGGFEMGNVWYNEPKTLDVAFDVISDVTMTMAALQYGGFTIPRVDTILAPYAEKSYQKFYQEYLDTAFNLGVDPSSDKAKAAAVEFATKKVRRDFEQGFQAWEYRFNTVGSSRGDYPFIAVSFGIDQSRWGRMATEVCLEVRKNGQGKPGFKKPVLFPKLTFLYDENLHGPGMPMEYLFDCAIECSKKCMYPKKIGA